MTTDQRVDLVPPDEMHQEWVIHFFRPVRARGLLQAKTMRSDRAVVTFDEPEGGTMEVAKQTFLVGSRALGYHDLQFWYAAPADQ